MISVLLWIITGLVFLIIAWRCLAHVHGAACLVLGQGVFGNAYRPATKPVTLVTDLPRGN